MKTTRRTFIKAVAAGTIAATVVDPTGSRASEATELFLNDWPERLERTWVGPEFWANRLQDWQVTNGRLECVQADPEWPMRTVHLLTRRLGTKQRTFTLTVRTGVRGGSVKIAPDAAVGFLIGAGGDRMDYRGAALIHHTPGVGGGIFCGATAAARPFIRPFTAPLQQQRSPAPATFPNEVLLRLDGQSSGTAINLRLTVLDPKSGETLGEAIHEDVRPEDLAGGIALVSHPGSGNKPGSFWFRDLQLSGSIEQHDKRNCGPILSALYTVHNNILKLTAQMMPIGSQDHSIAELQIKQS
ncbi:MAG: twin-arginine translocation signal domain-containing protein, partial [Limisphaerales bacterium]